MKKLVFGLIATVVFGFVGTAQKIDLNPYITKNKSTVKPDNATFQDYLKQNESYMKGYTYSEAISLNQLNDANLSVFDLSLTKNSNYNHMYIVYNSLDKSFQTYLVKSSASLILIYSSLGEDLISINDNKGNANLAVTIADKRSCFGSCMDAAEETMTDDLVGWIAWNYSPGVQVAVAIHCAVKCR